MRNILLVFAFVTLIVKANCQTPETSTLTKEDYLKKYKNQKTAAWISLGGGIGMAVGGFVINLSGDWVGPNQNKGSWLIYLGGAATLASIPLFISAHKNKRRAASIAINNQNFLWPQQSSFCFKRQPAITLKMNL